MGTAKLAIVVGVWFRRFHQFGPRAKKLDRIMPDSSPVFHLNLTLFFSWALPWAGLKNKDGSRKLKTAVFSCGQERSIL